MFDNFIPKLPLIEVEYLEGELRRMFDREPLPGTLVYFDADAKLHRLALSVRSASDALAVPHPIKFSDCSIEGAHAVIDHKYRPKTKVLVRGTSAQTGDLLFQCCFQITNRKHEDLAQESFENDEDVFLFGTLVDKSMGHDERRVFHYGLKFVPDHEQNTDDLNLIYKSFLDTLFTEHRLAALMPD